jgi:hypothetical protein
MDVCRYVKHLSDPSYTNHTIEAHYAITSHTKWSEIDREFNYHAFYYNIIETIRDSPDKEWVICLKKWWNM